MLVTMMTLLLSLGSSSWLPVPGPAAGAAVSRVAHCQPRLLAPPIMAAGRVRGDNRRTSKVGHVVRSELSTVIREGRVRGKQKCPSGLELMVSVVDVDMSPDLRNARVKVSVIGDRKAKISAVRWLRSNVRGFRHVLAQRNRHMKRVPMLTFDHVDVGAATDMMVRLEEMRNEADVAEARRVANGEYAVADEEGGIDFAAKDEEAWDEEEEEVIPQPGDAEDEDEEAEAARERKIFKDRS